MGNNNIKLVDTKNLEFTPKFSNELVEKEFRALKNRIKTTRKSRILASKRLRDSHQYHEKVVHFYSLILLILSIWFLSEKNIELATFASKVLLIFSISLTYLTMYLNLKNYKERASNFENNYQVLDVLTNKLDRYEAQDKEIDINILKQIQREYEKSIIGSENHKDIDFFINRSQLLKEKLNFLEKRISNHIESENKEELTVLIKERNRISREINELKGKIMRNKFVITLKKIGIGIFPLIILIIIFGVKYIFQQIINILI